MSLAINNPGGAGTSGSNPEDNMNNITEMIRTNSSMRQTFIDIASQRDPALGQQLAQSLRLLDKVTRTAAPQGAHGTLSRKEQEAIQRLTDRGFDKKQALVAYLVSDKNEGNATHFLANNKSDNSTNSNNTKTTKLPAIGKLINDNPALRQGLKDFIAQNHPALAQEIKENPSLLEGALEGSTDDGSDGTAASSLVNPKSPGLSGSDPITRGSPAVKKNEESAAHSLVGGSAGSKPGDPVVQPAEQKDNRSNVTKENFPESSMPRTSTDITTPPALSQRPTPVSSLVDSKTPVSSVRDSIVADCKAWLYDILNSHTS